MERISVQAFLLQPTRVECGGGLLTIRLKKAQALLFYLLVRKKASREELTGLLWADEDEELSRRHLRDDLYHLKKAAPIELIVPDGRSSVQLNPVVDLSIDVDGFLASQDISSYHDGFLPAFSVSGSAEYLVKICHRRMKK